MDNDEYDDDWDDDNDDDQDHVVEMMLIVIMRSHFVKICGRVEYLPGYETTCFPQQSGGWRC